MGRKIFKAIGATLRYLFESMFLDDFLPNRRRYLEVAVLLALAGLIAYLWVTRGL
jgi:hypothetical protein